MLLKYTTISFLITGNHRSSNAESAIMQDFLEKGESSTGKLQPFKKKSITSYNSFVNLRVLKANRYKKKQ